MSRSTLLPSAADGTSGLEGHLTELLMQLAEMRDPELARILTRLAAMTAAGHACIDLRDGTESAGAARLLDEYLSGTPIIGPPGELKPIVLDGDGRLYLRRYWDYEQRLAADLRARAERLHAVDEGSLRRGLARLFPSEGENWQKAAAAVAVARGLCILSGGPGTGKTTTVVRVLALIGELHRHAPLRIALAAPTGKAAARMQEAVRQARAQLPVSAEVQALIPDSASTLHRLLGGTPESAHFRFHRGRPLPLDMLVVDEASMVDLALMAKLVDALPAHARLLLVGDKDQLASVEPGAVLGSLCPARNAYTPAFASWLRSVTGQDVPVDATSVSPLRDAIVLLERSYRFAAGGGIAALAGAVRDGDAARALEALRSGGEIVWVNEPMDRGRWRAAVEPHARRYAQAVGGGDPAAAFGAFAEFRVLAAVRQGAAGVEWLNSEFERVLAAELGVTAARGWFAGRAIMVRHNHHGLHLFNGDIGVALNMAGEGGLRVVFQAPDGRYRMLAPARLPEHEPAYALTIHKSQGSEFGHVLVLLPAADAPVLTRELLYTAVTRARNRVEIWAPEEALRAAIGRRTERASGLRAACWGAEVGNGGAATAAAT
jgi:exodeoxyribonuclease V alpha subunit